MDGGQLKNVCLSVCLSSVICPLVVPNYFLICLFDWDKFFYKN
jgi:hypothetical protein